MIKSTLMKSILIPTDFSDNAMNAIEFALEFFKHHTVEFYFMHAYQNEVYDHLNLISRDDFDEVLEQVKTESQSNLEALLATVEQLAPNPRYTFHTISSYNTLVEEADLITDAKAIDLIVMGTKGLSNNRSIVYGSNTLNVLKYVQCPVMAIPADFKKTPLKHVLFSTNYLFPYKRRELKLLSDLLSTYRSKIDVVYVTKTEKLSIRQEDNKAFLKETLNNNEIDFHCVDGITVENTILNYIKKSDIDMLVLVNTRHSFIEGMLFDSPVDKMSLNIKIPLLVLQNSRRDE